MQEMNPWLASRLLHYRVRNSAGEDLGKIEDVVVDPETGNVQYAVLSFGGVFGLGNKLFPIPWSSLRTSSNRDYVLLDLDKETLRRAPGYDRDSLPNWSDPSWRRSIHEHYGTTARPIVRERPVYAERYVARPRRGISLLSGILLICLIAGLAWMTYLVATRGWDQAKQDVKSSFEGAAYAAKETSHDAALTTKVKTALSLSKRIPSDKIDVDSEKDVVTLRGEVPSEEVRDAAESVVRDVPGVGEVQNHLFVANKPK
jgi:sporulation protein YlmC with PRC-barrel domain